MKIRLEDGAEFDAERLENEKWLSYLYYTEYHGVNMERVDVVEQISGRETLSYVLRTLEILQEDACREKMTEREVMLVKQTLEWAEVSKGGSVKERERWRQKGYALDIHNLASAEIYLEEAADGEGVTGMPEDTGIVYILIRTHGLIGQALRGEVCVAQNRPLLELLHYLDADSADRIVRVLNHCIIGAVRKGLWEEVCGQTNLLISRVLAGDLSEFPVRERMRRLDERLENADEETKQLFEEKIFPNYELWYFQAAFSDFSADHIKWLLQETVKKTGEGVLFLSFKPIADGLYYDYEGKKHLNIYKERIVEKYIRDHSVENVELIVCRRGRTVMVDFHFSAVCEKLIEFCVEAERCGLLSFEKSITVLYDMFGFRRDEFDRMNNEEKYLQTMNASESSTKNSIIDYVTGHRVADVGSGGGVLLDLLEKQYPDKEIIGTDISENVIEELQKKKEREGHLWSIRRHNFAEGPFPEKLDTVIFSSILHEIFSYTETEKGRFEIETVKRALKNAYDSLLPGGRIVIRDGVKSPVDDRILRVTFKTASGLDFFKNYVRDFKGLKDIENPQICIFEEENAVSACRNYMREFLYTYTWGGESYAHEVQEQFGYFTIDEFRDFFLSIGAKLIRCDAFLEPGYVEHLSPLVELLPDEYPDSNCIVVAEK
ncbi:MAG: methyltransferase [Lachnospiraceae bacterium]|nr:methyltransferase [Lachnospiraceae bacterium]